MHAESSIYGSHLQPQPGGSVSSESRLSFAAINQLALFSQWLLASNTFGVASCWPSCQRTNNAKLAAGEENLKAIQLSGALKMAWRMKAVGGWRICIESWPS
jgi:hypothetical protein